MMTLDERRSGLILDDHPLWLEALEPLLREVGIDVVARASTAEEALGLLAEHKPDLFVADLHLNGGVGGAACVREALRRFPALNVIVLSGFDDPASVEEALSAPSPPGLQLSYPSRPFPRTSGPRCGKSSRTPSFLRTNTSGGFIARVASPTGYQDSRGAKPKCSSSSLRATRTGGSRSCSG